MKKTKLHSQHLLANAKMAPFGGWDMPIQYTSIKEEVNAVRTAAGMFDTSHMGIAIIDGDDHSELTDYIQTNNFSGAPMGKAVYGLLCNEDGGVKDDLISYKIATDKTLICVNASNTEGDFQFIQKCIQDKKFKVGFHHLSNYGMIALQGPNAMSELIKLESFNIDAVKNADFKKMSVIVLGDIYLARSGYTGEDGFEIFAPNDKILSFWKSLENNGVIKCGLGSRDVLRIEAAFPLYGHELNENISPLDAGLEKFVDMNKSNFVGKAALLTRPLTFRKILFSIPESIPRQGFEIILENKKVGEVTSGTLSSKLNAGIGMGLVNTGCSFAENSLMIRVRNRDIPAKLHKRNFLK
ncbi:MAG: glycine cleavage system aminomethyltransferase GcvT [Bacteriovoracaceae bacterium]|nr:glycine cleavage system aminomethyltransferase GcvT [Bacteriovoracaceae bacterium]